MKKLIVTFLTIILLLSLTACGGGGGGGARSAAVAPESPAMGGNDAGRYDYGAAAPEADYPYDYEVVAEDSAGGSIGSGGSVTDGRKITFSASVSLNTKQFDADYTRVYALIENSGGFVASENMIDNSAAYGRLVGRYTNISARIPAGDYSTFIDAVSAIGEVTQKNKWSEDLTSQYFDTEARVKLLELRKERLMGYILEAEKAEDLVAFERELSDVLYDLDFYQGNIRRMDRLVEYASVDISLTELITPETIGKDGEPLGARASEAFSMSLTGVGRFLENFVVGFAAALPVIILLIIIGAVIWVIVRVTRPLREKFHDRREDRRDARADRQDARRAERAEKRSRRNKQQPYGAPYWQQPGYQQQPVYQQQPQAPQPQPQAETPPASEPKEDK